MVAGPAGLEETALVLAVIVERLQGAEDLDGQGFGVGRPFFHGDEAPDLGRPPGQDVLGPLEDGSLLAEIEPAPDRVGRLGGRDGLLAELPRGDRNLADGLEGGRVLGDELHGGLDARVADDEASVHVGFPSRQPARSALSRSAFALPRPTTRAIRMPRP